jgi:hypothetical protein
VVRAAGSVLDGTIEPGKILDATTDLDGVPAGYRTWPTAGASRSSSSPDLGGTAEAGLGLCSDGRGV